MPCFYVLKTRYAFIVFNLHSSGTKYSYFTVDAGIIYPSTFYGPRGGAVDCDTARVRFPIVLWDFFILLILLATLRTKALTEMGTRNISLGVGGGG